MKVAVRKWRDSPSGYSAMDAYILWRMGKMPGACFERIALTHGKEKWLIAPAFHGEKCPSNGEYPGIECRCNECDFGLECFPEFAPDIDDIISEYGAATANGIVLDCPESLQRRISAIIKGYFDGRKG